MKNFGIFLIVVILAIIAVLIYKSGDTTIMNNPTPSPTSTVTPSPQVKTANVPIVVTDSDVAASNSTALLSGNVNPNGAFTTYWYEYGPTTALGTRSSAQTIGSGFAPITAPGYITGLHANTLYYFRLSAKNQYGTVTGATHSFETNNNPPPQAVAPTTSTLSASGISRTTANINGRINPNSSEASYWFEYGPDTNLGNVTSLQSAGDGNTLSAVSVSLSGLNPLTKYYFRLNSQNQYGTVNGSIMSFTTTGPAAPGAPTVDTRSATNIATSSVSFNGRLNTNGVDTTYWFEYSTNSLLGNIIGTATPSQSLAAGTQMVDVSAQVTNLAKNTKYSYRLVGQNQYGTVRGDVVSFTTRN